LKVMKEIDYDLCHLEKYAGAQFLDR
jgi:hypothetical protein